MSCIEDVAMKLSKALVILLVGSLTACAKGGSFDVGGLDYNGLNDTFSGLSTAAVNSVPTSGTAVYVGGYSMNLQGGPLAQGAATLSANFTSSTVDLTLLGQLTGGDNAGNVSISGVISGAQILPVAGGDIMTGDFYDDNAEVAAGRFELSDKSKGQYIVERTTACTGGACP